jgi:DNA-directed RNA polymerase specialized sigma subunit
MKKQYKEYKVLDKDISEFYLYDEKKIFNFDETEIETIEDIYDLSVSDLKKWICEKIEDGEFMDFIEKLCRNRLLSIIPILVLDKKEFLVYDLFYKNKETQTEIGKRLGVTRQSINKTVKKINMKFDIASENILNNYY